VKLRAWRLANTSEPTAVIVIRSAGVAAGRLLLPGRCANFASLLPDPVAEKIINQQFNGLFSDEPGLIE